jgi:hypothetical protein
VPGRLVAVAALAVSSAALVAPPAAAVGLSVNLDQWASKSAAWQNGNLNGNNASYPEGGVVPFRLAIEGLKKGAHSIRISYDFTANGHKAYDFLATWNSSEAPGLCRAGGGGVSSLCPSLGTRSVMRFPSDPYVANGLRVSGAEANALVTRNLTLYGGTISGISGPRHAGSSDASSTAEFTVRFTSRGSAVLLAWGGHLAKSTYWDRASGGVFDGAAEVSGAPWHMRTLQLDDSGNRNQDRSIQSSAVYRIAEPVPPASVPSSPPITAPNPPPTGSTPNSPTGPGPRRATLTLPPTTTSTMPAARYLGEDLAALLGALLFTATTIVVAVRTRRSRPEA